jgi:hypothetical protein
VPGWLPLVEVSDDVVGGRTLRPDPAFEAWRTEWRVALNAILELTIG